jgi:hypothetical protein
MKPSGENVPPGVEFRRQYGIPELDIRAAGFDLLRKAHVPATCFSKCGSIPFPWPGSHLVRYLARG